MSCDWIIVRALPNQEQRALTNIKRVKPSLECYIPRFFDPVTRTVKPMFRPYLFVAIEDRIWRFLDNCWGVAKVLSFQADVPCFVPQHEIDDLHRKEDKHGVIQIGTLAFEAGQRVTLTAGPLRFHCGTYVGTTKRDHCKVELDGFFGSSVATEVHYRMLEKV